MCTGYLPEDDGPDPRSLWRSHRNRRWYHIHGKDDADYDRRLHKIMKVTREHGLVLNKKKCEAKSNSVKFFGCVYDKQSVPRSIKGQRHQGDACPTEQRRASELPWNGNISLTIHPTTIFSHSNTQRTSEDWCRIQLEHYISSPIWQTKIIGMWGHNTEVLQHKETSNNPSRCIWQGTRSHTHPGWWSVTFVSKVLTPTEQHYANNERELLTCVFSAEHFRTYVFGRHFMIASDHKSLEQISMKNLADAPEHLQRMLLWLQGYDFTIKYRPGQEMVIADTLSRYSPEDTPEILLDISVNHIYINTEKKWDYQLAIKDDPWQSALADTITAGWPNDIKDVPKALRPYHGQCDSLTVEHGLILHGEAIIVPPGERKKVLEQIHQGHLGTSKCQYRARQCIYWPGINKDIEQLVEACATCQRHWSQEPRQPLKPTPPPERPWQQLRADFMMFDGSEYLVIVNYYSKMPIVQKMPTSQCNSAKMITVLKELFAEHGIPEEIRSDNGSQFASHLFAEFTKDWNIKHSTSSPRNPRSDGQAESAVKIVKGLLTCAKCSGQDPYLTLLAYRSTPVDSHLWSPAEMLYQHALCTTVPQRIRHKDPYAAAEHERLEECATQSAANHDRTGCSRKAPLYAGQSVSVINNDRTLWLPATIVCTANHGSYIIKVIGGAEYRWAWDHIRECHPESVKLDMHPKVEVAGQPVTTPSTSEAVQLHQTPTAPTTPKQAAAWCPTAATHTQWKTPATADVQPPTGRTDVTPRWSGCVSKAPPRLIEQM